MQVNTRKKILRTFLLMGIILLGPRLRVQAEQYQDYTYEKGETITITGYSGNDKKLEIPNEINGTSVREIAPYAFYDCDSLEEIIISEGVVTIGESAFALCDNLKKVSIPKSVVNLSMKSLNNRKFITAGPIGSGCNIEFGWDETIPIYGLAGCDCLEKVTIPAGIKYISYSAFERCSNLKEMDLPDSVQGIGSLAFVNCKALEKITIPKSVKHINWPVFMGDENLVIYGYEDSVIEAYASQNGLRYESLGTKEDVSREEDIPGCYKYSLNAIKVTEEYLDDFYGEKYPDLGTTLEWGTEEEKRRIKELGLSITKDCKSEEEKIRVCYEWVRDNLEYDGSAFVLSADVLQRGRAACIGYASLLRDLLRVNGIKAVMADGYYGDMVNVVPVSWLGRENWEKQGLEGHAWVEVQYNNHWYLLDALWDKYMCDAEETAKFAYIEAVEGLVTVYYEGIPDDVANGIVFKDGKFYSYEYGMKNLGNSSFIINTTSVGTATPYDTGSIIYYEDGREVKGLDNGELITDGWYGDNIERIQKGDIRYYRPYGVTMEGAFVEHNGDNIYLGASGTFILSGDLADYKQLDGRLSIELGETLDLLSLKPWYKDVGDKDVWFGDYSSNFLTLSDDGKITGKSPGLAYVDLYVGNQETGSYNSFGSLTFYVVDRVEEITLSVSELTLEEKETYHLSWKLAGQNPGLDYYLKDKWVEISSSDETVAKVSCTGRIEALSAGEADIIVRSRDREEVEAVCKLIVVGDETEPEEPDPPVTPLAITSQPTSITVSDGEQATFTVAAIGEGLTYQWELCYAGDDTFNKCTFMGADTASLMVDATKARNGYSFRCVVTDKRGQSITSETVKLTVKVEVELGVSITASQSTADPGDKVTFTAQGNGGDGNYQYKFIINDTANDKWYKLQDFSSNNTIEWTATTAGTKRIMVDIRDGSGKSVGKNVSVVVNGIPELSAKFTASAYEVNSGDTVTLTAAAMGGSGKYNYKFIINDKTDDMWYRLQDFGSNNVITWKATTPGIKRLMVDVMDSQGRKFGTNITITVK